MSEEKRISFSAIWRIAPLVALTLCSTALVAALYHMLHPNSKPGLITIVSIATGILTAVFLRKTGFPVPRSIARQTAFLLCVGIILRTASVALLPNRQVSDFEIFNELATALERGDGYAYTGPVGLKSDVNCFLNNWSPKPPLRTAFRPPGYPFVLSLSYRICGCSPLAGKALNLALGIGIGLLIYALSLPFGGGIAFWAALLWYVTPSAVTATNLLCTEVATLAFLLLTIFLLFRSSKSLSLRAMLLWGFAAGTVAGYATLIRPLSQLIVAAGIGVFFIRGGLGRKSALLAVFIAGLSIPLAIWGIRNYREFGKFETQNTEMGIAMYDMTRELVQPGKERRLDSLNARMIHESREFERSKLGKEIGTRRFVLAVGTGHFVKMLGKNFLRAWRDDLWTVEWIFCPESNNPVSTFVWAERILSFVTTSWYIALLILAIRGIRTFPDISRLSIDASGRSPWHIGIIVYSCFALFTVALFCLFEGQPRYHFLLIPLLCMFAAAHNSHNASQHNKRGLIANRETAG